MTVDFELDGQEFVALNGGAQYHFTEAVSFVVNCETQDEVDEFWEKLSEGGEQGPCGWLKDKYGLSWQVVPTMLGELIRDADPAKSNRVMAAMLQMGKLEIEPLRRAYEGKRTAVAVSRLTSATATRPGRLSLSRSRTSERRPTCFSPTTRPAASRTSTPKAAVLSFRACLRRCRPQGTP